MKKKTSLEANSCWNFFDVSIRLCRLRVKWWRKNDYDYITQDQYAERHGRRQRRHPLKRLGSPTVEHGRIPSIKSTVRHGLDEYFSSAARLLPLLLDHQATAKNRSIDFPIGRSEDGKINTDERRGRFTFTVFVGFVRYGQYYSVTTDISQDRPSRSGPQKRASCGRLRLFSYGQLMRSFAHQSQNIGRYNYH